MGVHKLNRWQKAGALLPMAVLLGGAALTNTGLATTSSDIGDPGIPDVPTTAFDQPATVGAGHPGGIDTRAGEPGTLSTASASGIPVASLLAYHRAETLLAKADSSCQLPWTLLAAIGRVESNHGRSGGNTVGTDGVSTPGIFGIPLTGANGTAKVADTDSGALDHDAVYDRAVGPMQFLPGTWNSVAVDADGDGVKNPQDIDDAAAAGGVYLCGGTDDLGTAPGASAAVFRYNHSSSYVDLVLKIAAKYAAGEFSQIPNGYAPASALTSKPHRPLTAKQRENARKDETKTAKRKSESPTTAPATPSAPPPATPDAGAVTPAQPNTGSTGTVGANDTPLKLVTKPVSDLLTVSQARLKCILDPGLLSPDFSTCVYDLTH